MNIVEQDISDTNKMNGGPDAVTVSQNEWTMDIASQAITENVGVVVSQTDCALVGKQKIYTYTISTLKLQARHQTFNFIVGAVKRKV